jgi:hypothetical protein
VGGDAYDFVVVAFVVAVLAGGEHSGILDDRAKASVMKQEVCSSNFSARQIPQRFSGGQAAFTEAPKIRSVGCQSTY